MLSRKVIAQNITNLTDARYFAAWGVDYLSFNSIPDSEFYISDDKIAEIKDWVEGPKCLIEANALELDELGDGFILSNIFSSLPIVKESFFRTSFKELQKGLPDGKYIIPIKSTELEALQKLDQEHLMGLDLYFDISEIQLSDLDKLKNHGIIIQGGEEEKVGVKSFDDLDELYELLME